MDDREIPLSEEELQSKRLTLEDILAPMGLRTGDMCETCVLRYTCLYVWDAYNTDGDCLRSK